MIPAALLSAALLIALNVQTMSSPLAGAWLLFFLAGAACAYEPASRRSLLWWACLAWLAALGIATFVLHPVPNAAATMWILAAMPILALSLPRRHLTPCLTGFLAALAIYATGLILQMLLQVRYTNYEYWITSLQTFAVAWPLLDPNNAAAVLNLGLIPCFYRALRKPIWYLAVALFSVAMFATVSKAGAIAAVLGCLILLIERFGFNFAFRFAGLLALAAVSGLLPMILLDTAFQQRLAICLQSSMGIRIDLWQASLPLLTLSPLRGLGLGSFGFYYQQIRTEQETSGYFAHNDLLQFAIELGIPCTLIFCALIAAVALTTSRRNIASGAVMLAVLLQSMVEFQLYLPAITIPMGLALAYHIHNREPKATA
jgi:O-antigen ligase